MTQPIKFLEPRAKVVASRDRIIADLKDILPEANHTAMVSRKSIRITEKHYAESVNFRMTLKRHRIRLLMILMQKL